MGWQDNLDKPIFLPRGPLKPVGPSTALSADSDSYPELK